MEGRELAMGALLTLLGHANETTPRGLIQMAYLAQEARGVPLATRFRLEPFTPGSDRLGTDIEILRSWELIERRGNTRGGGTAGRLETTIRLAWPQPGRPRETDLELRSHAGGYREELREIGEAFIGAEPWETGLESALHFLQGNHGPERRGKVLESIGAMMPRIEPGTAAAHYDRMAEAGWFRSRE